MQSHKVLITTIPFGDREPAPLERLQAENIEYVINPFGRKITETELAGTISGFDALIAGTEPITEAVLRNADGLKLISRVGIGLDSVDLMAAERRGIRVSYTPDAPAPAVAELTIGLMLGVLRSIHVSSERIHRGTWHRYFGRRLAECTIGIIGCGRIGGGVVRHLSGFGPPRILVNDIRDDTAHRFAPEVQRVDKQTIYREADVISLHVPLTPETKGMIGAAELARMKSDAVLINTARGGIVNERALAEALRAGRLAGAAVDVFEQEPYRGELCTLENCLLTSHMGSMSVDCRTRMEIEATEEVIRCLTGRELKSAVPPDEYELQRRAMERGAAH